MGIFKVAAQVLPTLPRCLGFPRLHFQSSLSVAVTPQLMIDSGVLAQAKAAGSRSRILKLDRAAYLASRTCQACKHVC